MKYIILQKKKCNPLSNRLLSELTSAIRSTLFSVCSSRSLRSGTMTRGFPSSKAIAFPEAKCLVSDGGFLHPVTSRCGKHWQTRNAITMDLMLAPLSSSFETSVDTKRLLLCASCVPSPCVCEWVLVSKTGRFVQATPTFDKAQREKFDVCLMFSMLCGAVRETYTARRRTFDQRKLGATRRAQSMEACCKIDMSTVLVVGATGA